MCGIIAYSGQEPKALETLIRGLKSLEYRGYDSSGVATLSSSSSINLVKSAGKIINLEKKIALHDCSESSLMFHAQVGIGHTRWATHGEPSDINAHPHMSYDDSVVLVHNGIIRNYLSLKTDLIREGIEFQSETDTEVIANLFSLIVSKERDRVGISSDSNGYIYEKDFLKTCLLQLTDKLEGAYALAIILNKDVEKHLIVAKHESPLVIGFTETSIIAASDSDTIRQFTNKIVRLKDGEAAVFNLKELQKDVSNSIDIFNYDGKSVNHEVQLLEVSASIMDKAGYKHFLLKEINEQPAILSKMLANFNDFKLIDFDFELKDIEKFICIACGSAYHTALVLKYLLGVWAKVDVEVIVASEFSYQVDLINPNTLVLGISQSGETADTLLAMKACRDAGAKLMAITNKADSAIHNLCGQNTFITPAGFEVSVASTKAYTSQLLSHYLFALQFAKARDIVMDYSEHLQELRKIPILLEQILDRAEDYKQVALKYSNYRDFIFLGKGIMHSIAMEAALKLKELSYAHATAYPSGELKHGPIAILDENVPVLNFAIPSNSDREGVLYEKVIHNAIETKTRKSPNVIITCDSVKIDTATFDDQLLIPDIDQVYAPILAVIPSQFIAYYIAEDLGKDVDQPRNLAKSVTVE